MKNRGLIPADEVKLNKRLIRNPELVVQTTNVDTEL